MSCKVVLSNKKLEAPFPWTIYIELRCWNENERRSNKFLKIDVLSLRRAYGFQEEIQSRQSTSLPKGWPTNKTRKSSGRNPKKSVRNEKYNNQKISNKNKKLIKSEKKH